MQVCYSKLVPIIAVNQLHYYPGAASREENRNSKATGIITIKPSCELYIIYNNNKLGKD